MPVFIFHPHLERVFGLRQRLDVEQIFEGRTPVVSQSWPSRIDPDVSLQVRSHRASDLLPCATSCRNHVPPRATQENRTLVLGIMFENPHHENKALESPEIENVGKL